MIQHILGIFYSIAIFSIELPSTYFTFTLQYNSNITLQDVRIKALPNILYYKLYQEFMLQTQIYSIFTKMNDFKATIILKATIIGTLTERPNIAPKALF